MATFQHIFHDLSQIKNNIRSDVILDDSKTVTHVMKIFAKGWGWQN